MDLRAVRLLYSSRQPGSDQFRPAASRPPGTFRRPSATLCSAFLAMHPSSGSSGQGFLSAFPGTYRTQELFSCAFLYFLFCIPRFPAAADFFYVRSFRSMFTFFVF